MGVRGLLTFIKQTEAYDEVDLVEIARSGVIEIIVDTNAISRFITEISLKKMAKDYNNDFLLFPVGENHIVGELYYDFHMAFKDVGINLVWVVDGPKGVDEASSDRKRSTWKDRNVISLDKNDRIFQACTEKKKIENINDCGPIINLEFGLEQLKTAGATIINLLQGEADELIAYEYKKRNSYAILTHDTDFLIFKDCNVIFANMLCSSYNNDVLRLPFVDQINPGKIFTRPNNVRCQITNSKHVISALKLKCHGQLIATSILIGNDYSQEHCEHLLRLVGLFCGRFPHLTKIANYVMTNDIHARNMGDIENIRDYMIEHPDLEESIMYCQEVYSLRHVSTNLRDVVYDTTNNDEGLTKYLAEGVSIGKINRYCYSIHCGSYYRAICTEKLTPCGESKVYLKFVQNQTADCDSIMTILGDIRSRTYPYLLKKSLTNVREWRSRSGDFVDVPVQHSLVQADKIQGNPDGIGIFEDIWSHREPRTLNYNKIFGTEKALILYLLRYLYVINNEKNLRMSEQEFKSLFITVFYQYVISKKISLQREIRMDKFMRMKICPSARCLTIASWFMNMYYTAKYICGGALNLTEVFPSPAVIMNGSTLFAFYEVISGDGSRVDHLRPDHIRDINSLEDEIMTIFITEYNTVTLP